MTTEGFYVSVERVTRHGLLLGPYDTKAEAEGHVQEGRDLAVTVDPFTAFDGFGVTRLTAGDGRELPEGKLNTMAREGSE